MVRVGALCWGALLLLLLTSRAASGQEANRAGLVIIHGDGAVISRCVEFGGDSISGYDLLEQAELDLNVEASGMGATICRLDGEGCSAPRESCFCQCQGGSTCLYWSYWQVVDGEWRYSNLGAGNSRVQAGAVEGWVWGDGQAQQASNLPRLTFAQICQSTPEREVAIGGADAPPLDAVTQSAPQHATTSITGVETTGQTQLSTLLLVLLPLPFLGAAYLVWRRKGSA